jgi:WD40 repeat protein
MTNKSDTFTNAFQFLKKGQTFDDTVSDLRFSSDGKYLITGSSVLKGTYNVRIIDVHSKKIIHELAVDNVGPVKDLIIGSDQDSFYVLTKELTKIDIASGKIVKTFKDLPLKLESSRNEHFGRSVMIAISPDGKSIFGLSNEHESQFLRKLNLDNYQVELEIPVPRKFRDEKISFSNFILTPDGNNILALVGDFPEATLKIFNANSGDFSAEVTGTWDDLDSMQLSYPDGRYLFLRNNSKNTIDKYDLFSRIKN